MWHLDQQSASLPLAVIPVKSWDVLLMVSQKQGLPSLGYICKYTSKHHQKIPFRNLKTWNIIAESGSDELKSVLFANVLVYCCWECFRNTASLEGFVE